MYAWDNIGGNGRVALNQISHLHFTQLTFLHIQESHIDSVEALPRMFIPHIESLHLCRITAKGSA